MLHEKKIDLQNTVGLSLQGNQLKNVRIKILHFMNVQKGRRE